MSSPENIFTKKMAVDDIPSMWEDFELTFSDQHRNRYNLISFKLGTDSSHRIGTDQISHRGGGPFLWVTFARTSKAHFLGVCAPSEQAP